MLTRTARVSAWVRELSPWLIGVWVVLSANCSATALMDTMNLWLSGQKGVVSAPRIFYCVMFAVAVILMYRQRGVFFPPRTRLLTTEPAEHRKHLVLFLSNLHVELEATGGVPQGLALTGDIEADLMAIEAIKRADPRDPRGRWSWEMPLRAIREQSREEPLETVTLICSEQSQPQAHMFVSICSSYGWMQHTDFFLLVRSCRSGCLVKVAQGATAGDWSAWNFESFDELSRAVHCLLKELKHRKYPENEIMIDFTGGQKVTSVVAAAMTFNRQIKAQYVQTNHPWAVLSYDVVYAHSDKPELGL